MPLSVLWLLLDQNSILVQLRGCGFFPIHIVVIIPLTGLDRGREIASTKPVQYSRQAREVWPRS